MKISPELHVVLERLTPAQLRLFACDCAEHVISLFEQYRPTDLRPQISIATARRYAAGQATSEQLNHAMGQAECAAYDAASDAPPGFTEGDEEIEIQPEDFPRQALASIAATAEACCCPDPMEAVIGASCTAIEAVVLAKVGLRVSGAMWWNQEELLSSAQIHAYRQAENEERNWQLKMAQFYVLDRNIYNSAYLGD